MTDDPEWILETCGCGRACHDPSVGWYTGRFDELVAANMRRERELIQQRWAELERQKNDLRRDPSPTG
jgi:hypothetical protein